MMNIFLIGFMGSGKSTLAGKLAEQFSLQLFDLDRIIEEKMNMKIREIFEEFGEAAFRDIEKKAFQHIAENEDNYVMATGGGTPCDPEVMRKINECGLSVYLKMLPEELTKRLKKENKERPLVKGKKENDLRQFIIAELKQRSFFYFQAQWVIHPVEIHEHYLFQQIETYKNQTSSKDA